MDPRLVGLTRRRRLAYLRKCRACQRWGALTYVEPGCYGPLVCRFCGARAKPRDMPDFLTYLDVPTPADDVRDVLLDVRTVPLRALLARWAGVPAAAWPDVCLDLSDPRYRRVLHRG